MKKLIFIFLILFVSCLLLGAPGHDIVGVKEASLPSTLTWQIVGTEVDTSAWYLSHPTMTFAFFARDTSSNGSAVKDSVDLTIQFQSLVGSMPITAADTKTLSSTDDSTYVEWKKTDTSTNSGMKWRLIITGGSDNDTQAGSLIDIDYDGFPTNYR